MLRLFVVFAMVMILMRGCSPTAQNSFANQISKTALTAEQQEIVNLLSFGSVIQNILLFDFTTEEYFTSMELWVDVYEYGVIVEQLNSISLGTRVSLGSSYAEPMPLDGQMAVIVSSKDNVSFSPKWTLVISEGGAISSALSNEPLDMGDDIISRDIGMTFGAIEIHDGTEIVLMTKKFSRSRPASVSISHTDLQVYLEQPELLENYPYAQIVKARFSR